MKNNDYSNERYDNLPIAYALLAKDYRVRFINPHFHNLLKLSKNKPFIGVSFFDLFSDEKQKHLQNLFKELDKKRGYQASNIFITTGEDSGNQDLLMSVYHQNEEDNSKNGYFVVGMPIEKSQILNMADHHIIQNQSDSIKKDRYKSIFNKASIGIAVIGQDGVIEENNLALENHIGRDKSAIINHDYRQLFGTNAKEQLHNLINILRKTQQSYVKDVVSMQNEDDNLKILEISLSEMCDDYDNTRKLMLVTEDITDQKDTHAAMLQSEKLALTGTLAASLAHEINNPLQTSLGCLGLVEEMLDESDDQDKAVYINLAVEELQRSARIVKQLRDLNRTTNLTERSRTDIREIIEDVLVLTKNHLIDKNIDPVFDDQGSSPLILASEDQIKQVVLNLVMNAIDALPNGGTIYFDIERSDVPKGVTITIRDTGDGINEAIQNNLFDPFLTTKDEGLGLGLYISKKIIEDHDGSLNYSSKPGQGTTFTIWLPDTC